MQAKVLHTTAKPVTPHQLGNMEVALYRSGCFRLVSLYQLLFDVHKLTFRDGLAALVEELCQGRYNSVVEFQVRSWAGGAIMEH